MFDFFKKSLRNKLLTIFMVIGFFPFLTLLAYTIFLSEKKIVNKTVNEQAQRAKVMVKLIDGHINGLIKEVNFLSELDLMDDLVAEDIDKRISRLLIQKANDLELQLVFMALSEDGTIVSSSNKELIQKKYPLDELQNANNKVFIKEQYLYIISNIMASFDETKQLGYLVLEYNLHNLDTYLTHKESIHSYIVNDASTLFIGEKPLADINFFKDKNHIINDSHVIVHEELSYPLKGLNIVYAVDKQVALEFLYDFISFMLYISAVIFVLVIYISIKQSREIVKPIEELTALTKSITKSKNYTTRLELSTSDEIATLTHSFNAMLETTSSALHNLEEESKLRLQRFTQLIDVFNTIIQTKSEDECIVTSIQEIKKLTHKHDLSFQKTKSSLQNQQNIDLYVTDFDKNETIYFGSIAFDSDDLKDIHENNFYNSIASMITLQLDRIRLIQKTMSASNAKSAFISNMSHELRTPLNAIIGFAQYMITYEELNDDQLDTVGNIESSAQYLLSMINEILDIAKIEAGKMELYIENLDVQVTLESIRSMLEPLASEKDLQLVFDLDAIQDISINTDVKMFKQIVINLLSNAIKFTEEGLVSLNVNNTDETLLIAVKDSGIGISKEDMAKLFEDFTQVENVMQKKHKGTGLGLSLSKKMAKLLNGDIDMYSDGLGHGTVCTFKILKE